MLFPRATAWMRFIARRLASCAVRVNARSISELLVLGVQYSLYISPFVHDLSFFESHLIKLQRLESLGRAVKANKLHVVCLPEQCLLFVSCDLPCYKAVV